MHVDVLRSVGYMEIPGNLGTSMVPMAQTRTRPSNPHMQSQAP